MELNEQSVNAYKTLLTDPAKHGLPFRKITDCFKQSTKARANHLLYEDFKLVVPKGALPKVIFYIIMEELYADKIGKDKENDCKGFYLEFIPA